MLLFAVAVAGCAPSPEPGSLALLITVDTLRADRLGAYGSDRGLTPNLDRLAGQSQLFEVAYAPSSLTIPSLTSILTGLYPEQVAIYVNEHRLPDSIPTLTEHLAAGGYRTGAIVSSAMLSPGTGLDRGFERYDDHRPDAEVTRGFPERLAAATTDAALAMLDGFREEQAERIFLWIHYQDPHGPYTPPAAYLEAALAKERERSPEREPLRFGQDHRGLDGIPTYQRLGDERDAVFYRASYDAEVQFTDAEIGRLLDGLAARDLLESAVVAFAADHGEGLGEHDYWFAHGEYLIDALVRVPFLLRVPGLPAARHGGLATLLDVMPTLASVLGITLPAGLPGRDLLVPGDPGDSARHYLATLGASTVPRYGLVRDGFKYLVVPAREDEPRTEQLFRLGDDLEDLSAREPERVRAMREELEGIHERVSAEGQARGGPKPTKQALEMLRKLGYVR